MLLAWAVILALLVGAFLALPFFRGDVSRPEDPEIAALEAAREAKYREIKEAEIDFRLGKLERADYERIDTELRRDAVNILNQLEKAQAAEER